jgi:hypothetical protein
MFTKIVSAAVDASGAFNFVTSKGSCYNYHDAFQDDFMAICKVPRNWGNDIIT